MPDEPTSPTPDTPAVAAQLARRLEEEGIDHAFGGAIALAFAAEPRATVDVDVTLFLDDPEPAACLAVIERLGCSFNRPQELQRLEEYGYCRAEFEGLRVDVFLPTIDFYTVAREARRRVVLRGQTMSVWSAEVLAVFKMMFFREKDLGDVRSILQLQADKLDRNWVRERLVEIFGPRDPRIPAWDDLVARTPVE